jgi:putative transposase
VTYVATWSGFVYIAFVMVFSRPVRDAPLDLCVPSFALDALEPSLWPQGDEQCDFHGRVHHSDTAVQASPSATPTASTRPKQFAASGSKGDNHDDAAADSLLGLYTTGSSDARAVAGFDDVELATPEHVWFNHRRLHSHRGEVPPVECETNYYR